MLATVYKQDSLQWKIELLWQRVGEWWELVISQLIANAPDSPQLDLDRPWIRQIIKVLLWSIITVVLVWLTWQLWLLIRPYWIKWRKLPPTLSNVAIKRSQIKLSSNEWLAKSQYYQQQKDYRQAIFCLYQATIQELSDRNFISSLPSRTDREYVDLINNLSLVESQSYKLLLDTHEQLCFSDRDATLSLWKQCENAYQRLVNSDG